MPKICAVVVTYNRKNKLLECLDALFNQTYNKFDILVIDNNSTDGTYESIKHFLSNRVMYKNTKQNCGGAGGFYYGLLEVYTKNYEWAWVMDDDVIPNSNALDELVKATEVVPKASYFASVVYSRSSKLINTPTISDDTDSETRYKIWHELLDNGMARIRFSTFVSLLVNMDAVKRFGLPCKNYFIWGDDTEYTLRLTKFYGPAYLVGKSKVIHTRELESALNIVEECDRNRINLYYYYVRNTLINTKFYYSRRSLLRKKFYFARQTLNLIFKKSKYKTKKISIIIKGYFDFKLSKYDKASFKSRFTINEK